MTAAAAAGRLGAESLIGTAVVPSILLLAVLLATQLTHTVKTEVPGQVTIIPKAQPSLSLSLSLSLTSLSSLSSQLTNHPTFTRHTTQKNTLIKTYATRQSRT